MSNTAIKTELLSKSYGKIDALKNFSVDIPAEGIVGLVGRNGSGKTTFMRLCAGRLDKSEGELNVLGAEPMDNISVLEDILYTYHDMEYEKGKRLCHIIRDYSLMFKDFDAEFAGKLLHYFNLNEKAKPSELSQGGVSIFNFICGLATRAKLTMFDEPVLGLDITVRRAAYEVLLRDYTEHPRCIIVSSHLLAEIELILSDLLLIDEGRLVLFDDMEELRESAYMVRGAGSDVESFCRGKNVIARTIGIVNSAIVYEKPDERARTEISGSGLEITLVSPEDLYIYLTKENKEGELSCLWQKAN